MKKYQQVIVWMLAIVSSVCMIFPHVSEIIVDYARPLKAVWVIEKGKAGGKSVSAVVEFSSANVPYFPFLLVAIILGVAFVVKLDDWTTHERQFSRSIKHIFLLQLLLAGVSAVLFFAAGLYFDVSERLAEVVPDSGLREQVMIQYVGSLFSNCFLTVFLFLFGDVLTFAATALFTVLFHPLEKAYIHIAQNMLSDLDGQHGTLALRKDGAVERVEYKTSLSLFPLPLITPRRVVTHELPWTLVVHTLLQSSNMWSQVRLANVIKQAFGEIVHSLAKNFAAAVVTAIESYIRKGMDVSLQKFLTRAKGKVAKRVETLLQQVSDATLTRFQQDMVERVGEAVQERIKVLEEQSLQFLEQYSSPNKPVQLALMPPLFDGVRYCFRSGKSTVYVIEEKPQLRTLSFSKQFIRAEGGSSSETRIRLAFPYIIFVVQLHEGRFNDLYIYYSQKPLSSMKDRLFSPNLTNIRVNSQVCLNFPGCSGTEEKEVVQSVLSYFWQSEFNADLRGEQYDQQNPVKNIWDWKSQSEQDPSFVLKAHWRPSPTELIARVKSLLLSAQEDEKGRAERVLRESMQQMVTELKQIVTQICSNIPVHRRYPKTISKELAAHLYELAEAVAGHVRSRLDEAVKGTEDGLHKQFEQQMMSALSDKLIANLIDETGKALLQNRLLPVSLYEALRQKERNNDE